MPQSCDISTCDLTSLTACLCCDQYLCRDHFVEHDYLLRSKLNVLTGQINELADQIGEINIDKIASDVFLKLDQWRFDSYKIIDTFYEKKCQELNHHIREIFNKQDKDVNDLRLKIAKMINVQQTTNNNMNLLMSDIKTLRQQMNHIEHMSIEVNICPLVIKDTLIKFDTSNSYRSDSSKLPSPYQVIDRVPLSSDAMGSNNQCLLVHQNSTLYLIDENLVVLRENKWPNDWIRDICWSQLLNCFFIITLSSVYMVEEKTLLIKHVQTIEGRFWQSCTCSDKSLYLSKDTWNSAIDEFSLKPSIKFIKRWERKETVGHKQRIDSIQYCDETLALAVNDLSKQELYIEVRSTETFDRLWLCQIGIEYSERKIQCCLLNHDTWIVADWGTSSLFYITKDGKLESTNEYEYDVHRVNILGTNKLVIATADSIHFHKL